MPSVNAAAAEVKRLKQTKEEEVLTAADKERRKAWKPKVGELVRVTKAGNSTGKVQHSWVSWLLVSTLHLPVRVTSACLFS